MYGQTKEQTDTNHYSLEMIIAVGFKVNSERAVQFRKWVNQIAKDYTIKGWVMDDERLKRGTYLTEKYFDEQLERIREIRASWQIGHRTNENPGLSLYISPYQNNSAWSV